jgi:hypothetical protein
MKTYRPTIGVLIAIVLVFFGTVLLINPEPEYSIATSEDGMLELSGIQSDEYPIGIELKTENGIREYTLMPEGEYPDRDMRIEIAWDALESDESLALYQFDLYLRAWRFLAGEEITSLPLDILSPLMIAPAIPEEVPIFASDHDELIQNMPRAAAGVDIWSEISLEEGYPVIIAGSEYQGGCNGEYFASDRSEFSAIEHSARIMDEIYQLKTAARFSLYPEPLCTAGDFYLRDFAAPDTL